jgi:hypothetical protein
MNIQEQYSIGLNLIEFSYHQSAKYFHTFANTNKFLGKVKIAITL